MAPGLQSPRSLDEVVLSLAIDGGTANLSDAYRIASQGGWKGQVTVQAFSIADEVAAQAVVEQSVGEAVRPSPSVIAGRGLDEDGEFTVSIWPAIGQVWLLVSSSPVTSRRWRRVERSLSALAPRVAPCFLNDSELESLGTSLSKFGRVEVSKVTARDLFMTKSIGNGYRENPSRPRATFQEVVAEFAGIASIRTLTLHVADLVTLHLRRNAGATFYSGDFDLFADEVLGPLASAVHQRRHLMEGRERQRGSVSTSPLEMRFAASLFRSADDTANVIQAFNSLSEVGVAVLHRNPYLHLVVTDFSDGSNVDVLVTETDAITLVPGFRSSPGALMRLTERLGELLGVAEIGERTELPSPTLEELFAS